MGTMGTFWERDSNLDVIIGVKSGCRNQAYGGSLGAAELESGKGYPSLVSKRSRCEGVRGNVRWLLYFKPNYAK